MHTCHVLNLGGINWSWFLCVRLIAGENGNGPTCEILDYDRFHNERDSHRMPHATMKGDCHIIEDKQRIVRAVQIDGVRYECENPAHVFSYGR